MSECGDTVFVDRSLMRFGGSRVSVLGVLQSLPRMLAAGQMILLSALLFSTAMAVRGDVVEFPPLAGDFRNAIRRYSVWT